MIAQQLQRSFCVGQSCIYTLNWIKLNYIPINEQRWDDINASLAQFHIQSKQKKKNTILSLCVYELFVFNFHILHKR